MSTAFPFPIRNECPPGACVCDREKLLNDPQADIRVLRLTREEEKRLIARINEVSTLAELQRIQKRLFDQLGIVLHIAPGPNEVRTMRGLDIRLMESPGLCKKIRQSVPAAIRRCLERNPEIAYAILDAHDLLGGGSGSVGSAGSLTQPDT
ncbi:hypothetical protein Q8A64_09915 [Oxalobacteraceae bacterium R-40]|uniref:Ribosomal protein S3AE n=1 Tax=Keguizhuia sedimenti TaxID=3064264 RepID=A0ABU1BQZ5_9BURK|nr:hypothetical protein [Oxalobacteraceae bacterium R-40]